MSDKPEALRLADALEGTPDCDCAAWSSNECACNVAWPDYYIKPAAAELRRLHAENESLRLDAVRYQWLRERAWFQVAFDSRYGDSGETLADLDAAIDAAMKGQQ